MAEGKRVEPFVTWGEERFITQSFSADVMLLA